MYWSGSPQVLRSQSVFACSWVFTALTVCHWAPSQSCGTGIPAVLTTRPRSAALRSPEHQIARLLMLSCTDQFDQFALRLAGLLEAERTVAAVLALLPNGAPPGCLPLTRTPSRKSATTLSIHASANGQAPAGSIAKALIQDLDLETFANDQASGRTRTRVTPASELTSALHRLC